MKLTVLLDNNTYIGRYYQGEPGVSYYIESEGVKVLFDVGYSDAYLRNADKMGIDLRRIDYLVLSHGHLDHTWGLAPLVQRYTEAGFDKKRVKRPVLLAHPAVFSSKRTDKGVEIGSLLGKDLLARFFDLHLTDKPYALTERMVFLGQIARTNDFEAQKPLGKTLQDGGLQDDFLFDDSALAYRSDQGLVVVSGCSHSGICNIIEYAREICREARVVDVIGGFHLLSPPAEVMASTLGYFAQLKPDALHACHCTSLAAKIALAKAADLKEVGVGLQLEY